MSRYLLRGSRPVVGQAGHLFSSTASGIGRLVAACVAIAVLFAGCGSTSGVESLDAGDAANALRDRDVHVPDRWVLGQMDEGRVFVGAADFHGRYDLPGGRADSRPIDSADQLVGEIKRSNPDFPQLWRFGCDELTVESLRGGYLGFSCTADTATYIATRTVDGQPSTPNAPDSRTLVLTHGGSSAHLFVIMLGH